MVGSGEGNVILEKAGEFSSKGRGKMWTSIGDYLGMEAESWENVGEKSWATPAVSMFLVQGQ